MLTLEQQAATHQRTMIRPKVAVQARTPEQKRIVTEVVRRPGRRDRDVIGMASLYAEAIARGHVFNDANKRTALTCAIAYIEQQGLHVRQDPVLEEATVMLA